MPDQQATAPTENDLATCCPQFTEGSTHEVKYVGNIPELQGSQTYEVALQGVEGLLMRSTSTNSTLIFENGSNVSKDGNYQL
jgi:hypothetical protein